MNRRSVLTLALPLAGRAAVEARGAAAPAAAVPAATPPLFPDDAQFWFETVRAFGAAEYGGAGFGEVLATTSRIRAGDYDSWYDAWNEAADRIAEEAAGQLARRHRVSARDSFLRASDAYRASEFFLHANPKDPRIARAYRLSVECYKECAALYDPPIVAVEIPYEHTTLPGYFHRPDRSGRRRPTLIMHTGFDGSAEELHVSGARAAVERGYNVLAFDGPGQFGPLHREGLVFRPDWEKVVTPVVDFVLARSDVDPRRVALMGQSLGGELAPRAAAFEKRLAALVADDGLYDYAAPHMAAIPPGMRDAFVEMLTAKQAPMVDQMLEGAMKASPTARWAFIHGMYATGAATPRAYFAKTLAYNLEDGIAEAISCPTLVCSAEDDLFFKGQPQALYDHLTCRKTMISFAKAEGAGAHCQVGAARLSFARIYDWLDETLS
jgi:poly(3-hydroxybutyrate) depolymerase